MSIRSEPHYEVASSVMSAGLEKHGAALWWSVDGDPLLTSRVAFPCPGDEFAEVLRGIPRTLLLQDPKRRQTAQGQVIGVDELDSVAHQPGIHIDFQGERPAWADNRIFLCSWKGSEIEWLIREDRETSKSVERDELELRAKK